MEIVKSRALAEYLDKADVTQAEVAERLGIQAPALSKWKANRVPPERVLDVERETGIPRGELRPDIYPLEATA